MYLKIKEIREFKNLTQDEIVLLSGIKKRTYVDYENGKADIPLSKLQKIASSLNVSLFDLFSNKNDCNTLNEPGAVYEVENNLVQAQKKTIAILEREVDDLRDDKQLLKNIINNSMGNAKAS